MEKTFDGSVTNLIINGTNLIKFSRILDIELQLKCN